MICLLLRGGKAAINRPLRIICAGLVVFQICLVLAACGGGGGGNGSGGNGNGGSGSGGKGGSGTPAGNYVVTVWANSGSLSYGEEFTITVE